jgi:hypothetical protein
MARGTGSSYPVPSSGESAKCPSKRLDIGKLSSASEENQNILIGVKQVALRRQCKRVYLPVLALAYLEEGSRERIRATRRADA